MNDTRILVVDDDATMLCLCRAVIQREGWRVECAADGNAAEKAISARSFDLVVLDLNLPDGDGLDIGRRLQKQGLPFLLMTARSHPSERLAGFEIGAADYLTKPFYPSELIHRIKRVLTRAEPSPVPAAAGRYRFGQWHFDPDRRRLTDAAGYRVELTPGEFKLLALLVKAGGRVVDREQLFQAVARGEGSGHYRTVDVLISRLRKKLEGDSRNPALIVTVTGIGYHIAEVRQIAR